ncbi:MAG: hypothetical protein AAF531_14110 [Actinomycetota bacterium]
MELDVRILLGPPRWTWVVWGLLGLQILWSLWTGPTFASFFTTVGIAAIAVAWERHSRKCALWLTRDEVVIANTEETHVVPREGAEAAVVSEDVFPNRYRSRWDDTDTTTRRLYIIPADPSRNRVRVEAARGLTPRRMRAVAEELELAFAESS